MNFEKVFKSLTAALQNVFTGFGSDTVIPSLAGFGAAFDGFLAGLASLIGAFDKLSD